MSFIKQYYIGLLAILLVASCGALKGTKITGTLTGAENMMVYLDNVTLTQQPNILLQETVGADGKFTFSLPEGIKDGTEKEVIFNGKLTDLNEFNYKVTGSKLTESYFQTVRSYIDQKMDVPALTTYTGKTADPLVAYQLAVRLFTLRPEFLDLHKEVAKKLTAQDPKFELAKEYNQWKHQRQK